MNNIRVFFLSENFQFLEVKFSIYLNRRVYVMWRKKECNYILCKKKKSPALPSLFLLIPDYSTPFQTPMFV